MFVIMLGFTFFSASMSVGAKMANGLDFSGFVSAVIIGGTSMSGGRGSIAGTLIGTLIIAVMNNLLTLVGVDPFLREAFKGFIVIAAVLLQKKEAAA